MFRLAVLFRYPGNYDTRSYEEVVALLHRGGDLYRDTTRYNYSPAWSFVLRGADTLSAAIGSDLAVAVGLVLLLVDGATALLLFRIAGHRFGPSAAWASPLLFFANPVSVAISSAHGQFDNLSILFLLLAILLAVGEPRRAGAAMGALSLSLLVKHVTWFHPLLFARRRETGVGWGAAVVPYLVFAASFLPYWTSLAGIRANVFGYTGLRRLYGTDALLLAARVPDWAPIAIFVAAAFIAVYVLRRVELVRASLVLFLVLLVFSPGISRQYFLWPIALGSLYPGWGYFLYTTIASGAILQLSSPGGGDVTFGFGWFALWWTALAWLLLEVHALRRVRRAEAAASA